VHRRCCANEGVKGGGASSEGPREEVSSAVMEEVGGVGWGVGCMWWAQSGYEGQICAGWVSKIILFGRNTPQIAIFMVVPPFWSSRHTRVF
jgi:hypothetical protein